MTALLEASSSGFSVSGFGLPDNTELGTRNTEQKACLFSIPDCDHAEWIATVPREERDRIRELFDAFREMSLARSLKAGSWSAALKRQHLGWGWSAKALRALYRAYRDGGRKPGDFRKRGAIYPPGDWRVLLRDWKGREPQLPEEFKRWLGEQWAQFKGRKDCVRALWRHVVNEIWLQGAPVPGFSTIDEWCRSTGRARPNPLLIRASELPDGWSEATFRRALPKREATRDQSAHGYLAAHAHQPDQVLTDRRQLRPLQFVFLDDSRPDFRCLWMAGGRGEIVYPLLVLGLDAACGVDTANCGKPRALKSPEAENEAERKERHGVTQDMALRVVVETLRKFGLPPWKITFVHENAAACVPPFARQALREAYGDRVEFEATGIFRQRMGEYGFNESGGAPYDKAPIEAFWRILMTQLARLAGSTGPRYDTQPGDLKEIERYTLALVARAGGLADLVARLRKPLLEFHDAHAAIEDALRLLRFRTKHNLQGFERVREWRRSPGDGYRPWEEFLALPALEQDAIAAAGPDAIVERLECPAERFVRLLQGVEMTPVDDDLLTWIAGPRFPATVRDGKIAISRIEIAPEPLIFRETDHPLLDEDAEGVTYEAALTGDAQRLVLTREGRILGSIAQQGRVSRGDPVALHREQGRVAAARRSERERFAGYYLADTDDALAELRAHNEAVLSVTPAIAAAPRPTLAAKPNARQRAQNSRRAAQLAARAEEQLAALSR